MIILLDNNNNNRITGTLILTNKDSEEKYADENENCIIRNFKFVEDCDLYRYAEDSGSFILIDNWEDIKAERAEAKFKRLLEQTKIAKNKQLETMYQTANFQPINYMGTTFKSGQYTQDTLVKVLSAGSVPDGFFWRDINNNNISMTYKEVQGFSKSLLLRGQENFVKLQTLKQQVREASNFKEVENIIWEQ